MYVIAEISGKQFKVAEGDVLNVPVQNAEVNDKLDFPNIMLLDNEGDVKIGTPFVKDVKVSAVVLEHGRDRKVIVFKKKRRKDYKVKRGHRQGYTKIRVDAIVTGGTKPAKAEPVKKTTSTKPAAPKKTAAAAKTEKE
ncbi:MAG: 50S ribosomal protein L21 [FCB group bacterium]|nr:50S ribosomal protein L21 [FCB group bacterium]